MMIRNIGILHYSTHWNMRWQRCKTKTKSTKPDTFSTKLFIPFVLTKKMHTHTWCFYSQTKTLQASEVLKWNSGVTKETYGKSGSHPKVDGWMDELGFYVPSTIFQSFRDNGRVNMKGFVQWSAVKMDGWVRVLRPFNSISVISRRWKGEHERLCAMKRRLGSGRISPPAGFEPGSAV